MDCSQMISQMQQDPQAALMECPAVDPRADVDDDCGNSSNGSSFSFETSSAVKWLGLPALEPCYSTGNTVTRFPSIVLDQNGLSQRGSTGRVKKLPVRSTGVPDAAAALSPPLPSSSSSAAVAAVATAAGVAVAPLSLSSSPSSSSPSSNLSSLFSSPRSSSCLSEAGLCFPKSTKNNCWTIPSRDSNFQEEPLSIAPGEDHRRHSCSIFSAAAHEKVKGFEQKHHYIYLTQKNNSNKFSHEAGQVLNCSHHGPLQSCAEVNIKSTHKRSIQSPSPVYSGHIPGNTLDLAANKPHVLVHDPAFGLTPRRSSSSLLLWSFSATSLLLRWRSLFSLQLLNPSQSTSEADAVNITQTSDQLRAQLDRSRSFGHPGTNRGNLTRVRANDKSVLADQQARQTKGSGFSSVRIKAGNGEVPSLSTSKCQAMSGKIMNHLVHYQSTKHVDKHQSVDSNIGPSPNSRKTAKTQQLLLSILHTAAGISILKAFKSIFALRPCRDASDIAAPKLTKNSKKVSAVVNVSVDMGTGPEVLMKRKRRSETLRGRHAWASGQDILSHSLEIRHVAIQGAIDHCKSTHY